VCLSWFPVFSDSIWKIANLCYHRSHVARFAGTEALDRFEQDLKQRSHGQRSVLLQSSAKAVFTEFVSFGRRRFNQSVDVDQEYLARVEQLSCSFETLATRRASAGLHIIVAPIMLLAVTLLGYQG
jgi:hypothetical protein